MSNEVIATISIVGGVFGVLGLILGLVSVAAVIGFTRSTHTVQYVPYENEQTLIPDPEIVEENEKALLDKVGKKKKEKPTVIEDLDAVLEEVAKSEISF